MNTCPKPGDIILIRYYYHKVPSGPFLVLSSEMDQYDDSRCLLVTMDLKHPGNEIFTEIYLLSAITLVLES